MGVCVGVFECKSETFLSLKNDHTAFNESPNPDIFFPIPHPISMSPVFIFDEPVCVGVCVLVWVGGCARKRDREVKA